MMGLAENVQGSENGLCSKLLPLPALLSEPSAEGRAAALFYRCSINPPFTHGSSHIEQGV